jgi:hypothetical protein
MCKDRRSVSALLWGGEHWGGWEFISILIHIHIHVSIHENIYILPYINMYLKTYMNIFKHICIYIYVFTCNNAASRVESTAPAMMVASAWPLLRPPLLLPSCAGECSSSARRLHCVYRHVYIYIYMYVYIYISMCIQDVPHLQDDCTAIKYCTCNRKYHEYSHRLCIHIS